MVLRVAWSCRLWISFKDEAIVLTPTLQASGVCAPIDVSSTSVPGPPAPLPLLLALRTLCGGGLPLCYDVRVAGLSLRDFVPWLLLESSQAARMSPVLFTRIGRYNLCHEAGSNSSPRYIRADVCVRLVRMRRSNVRVDTSRPLTGSFVDPGVGQSLL